MSEGGAVRNRFEALRKKLIDTSLRNRMLNFRMPRTHGVQVSGEESLFVYRRLVIDEREMSFDGKPDPPNQRSIADGEINWFDDEFSQAQFRDAAIEELDAMSTLPIPPTIQTDAKLNTNYTISQLGARLLKTFRDARLAQDETGVNMLYLAFGALFWREAEGSDVERVAPLVFVPVELKQLKNGMFKLVYDGGNVQDNLALAEKLREQRIELPRLEDGGDLHTYIGEVRGTVHHRKDWYVEEDWMTLSFFQFSKIAMYLDLNEDLWPEANKPSSDIDICAMLGEGYPEAHLGIDESDFIDDHRPVEKTNEVLNCDASQALAILRAQAGQSMVIEGPPGTGKSQTIVNLIAEFVGQGKTVLFVSEKMAALDVVDRQLAKVGLGDVVMKLHSKESKRREFYEELKRVVNLNKSMKNVASEVEQYASLREKLNAYCSAINTPIEPWGITPHAAIGFASLLPNERAEDIEFRIPFESLGEITWVALQTKRTLLDSYRTVLADGVAHRDHTWYGVGKALVTPGDKVTIGSAIDAAVGTLSVAIDDLALLSVALKSPIANSFLECEVLMKGARTAIDAPELHELDFSDSAWDTDGVLATIEDVEVVQTCKRRFSSDFDHLSQADIDRCNSVLTEWEPKWWRLFSSDFRQAAHTIRSLDSDARSAEELHLSAGDASRGVAAKARIGAAAAQMGRLFGSYWNGQDSDVARLREIASFGRDIRRKVVEGRLHESLLQRFVQSLDKEAVRGALASVEGSLRRASDDLNALFAHLQYRLVSEAFADLSGTLVRLRKWSGATDLLDGICRVTLAEDALREAGLGAAVDAAQAWPDAHKELTNAVFRSYFEGVLKSAYSRLPELAQFSSESHARNIEEFRQLDDLMFMINSGRVRIEHLKAIPAQAINIGNVGDLYRQMQLKRGHKPIRWALDRLGGYVQKVKPLFMMSPLSVSQFLPRSEMRFDVLIFDEASQVRPEDALAAIARSEQVIVVGDDKQLPPTSFFEKMAEGESEDDDDGVQGVQQQESVLGLMSGACQLGARITDLRYHYRSLHPNLIRVSNTEFYRDRLIVFPSSGAEEARGLVFHHNSTDTYDRGRTRANRDQAMRVIERVFEHMRDEPDRSLGIVAFSEAQQQALTAAFDFRLREEPELLEVYNARHPFEQLFIKNLETVQGDERDVIYISVGYGPDEHGKFNMAFGPINAEGGERRLNVLMTRAKRRCEVFSSFTAGDMRVAENPSRGVAVLKRFLQFAQTGELDDPNPTDRPPDSPFEEQVAQRLRALGHDVHHQVGSIGYAIDLAVVNPAKPGCYLLGIECDGASYHSARSARDRDKIRQLALEARGWRLHRIWSTDWWQNPDRVIARCAEAIERSLISEPQSVSNARSVVGEEILVDSEESRPGNEPYRIWRPAAPVGHADLHTYPLDQLAALIGNLVSVEGPVHEDVVLRRICLAFGLGRTGARIRGTVRFAVSRAMSLGRITREGEFLLAPQAEPTPRCRKALPAEERKAEWVADSELCATIHRIALEAQGAERAEIAASAWRLLGFGRSTEAMTTRGLLLIARLVEAGALVERDGLLFGGAID